MIFLLTAAAAAIAPIDCAAFARQADIPVVISSEPIPPSEIGSDHSLPRLPGTIPAFAVGSLEYSGFGISIRSSDPRFAQIEIGASPYLHHPCSYAIDGPTGWNARDKNLSSWVIRFEHRPDGIMPAPADAGQQGAAPVLAGYEPGQSSRLYAGKGSYFIGLMHRDDRQPETLVVAFSGQSGGSHAEIFARLPMRFDGLQVLPFIHGPGYDISLEGRDPDGTLHRANFTLPGPQADRLRAAFVSPEDRK